MEDSSKHTQHITNQHIHTTLLPIQQQEIGIHTVLPHRPARGRKRGIHTQSHHHTLTARPTAHLPEIALTIQAKEDITEYQVTSTIVNEHLQMRQKDTMVTNLQEDHLHRPTNLMTTKIAFTTNMTEQHSTMTLGIVQRARHIHTTGLSKKS